MGLLIKKELQKNNTLAIWKMEESIEKLISLIPEEHSTKISNIKRKKEWLTTRILLKQINPKYKIAYNKYNAPHIITKANISFPKKEISISHTKQFTTIIVGDKKVSVDIEKITEKPLALASKFMHLKNHKKITTKKATIIWCAKECLFKINQKGNINFKEDLLVSPFIVRKKGELITYLHKKKYKLSYEKIDNHYLVYFCNTL